MIERSGDRVITLPVCRTHQPVLSSQCEAFAIDSVLLTSAALTARNRCRAIAHPLPTPCRTTRSRSFSRPLIPQPSPIASLVLVFQYFGGFESPPAEKGELRVTIKKRRNIRNTRTARGGRGGRRHGGEKSPVLSTGVCGRGRWVP